jgi:hypothetical protein
MPKGDTKTRVRASVPLDFTWQRDKGIRLVEYESTQNAVQSALQSFVKYLTLEIMLPSTDVCRQPLTSAETHRERALYSNSGSSSTRASLFFLTDSQRWFCGLSICTAAFSPCTSVHQPLVELDTRQRSQFGFSACLSIVYRATLAPSWSVCLSSST